jgi:light-regulated signal transduction histidine kinase (bacteriophytochrome)
MKMVPPSSSGSAAIGQELARAREIINEFVYSCSHSMRGPLKSMTGLIHLLQQSIQTGNEDPQTYLTLMKASVNRMEALLQQYGYFL